MAPPTSLTLIASLQSPDNDAAWQRFATLYGEPIRNWSDLTCIRCGLAPRAAAELAQEATADALIQIWMSIRRYRTEGQRHDGGFRAWLHAITMNVTLANLRSRARDRVRGSGDSAVHWQIENVADPAALKRDCDHALNSGLRSDAIALTLGRAQDRERRVFQELMSLEKPAPEVLSRTAADLCITIPNLYQVKHRLLVKFNREDERLIGDIDAL